MPDPRTFVLAVVVSAEATSGLGTWSAVGMVDAEDQTDLPAGCVRKVVSLPLDGDRKFVRFKVTRPL